MTSFFTTSSLITCCGISGRIGDFIGDLPLERLNRNTRKAIAITKAVTRKMKMGRKATAITMFASSENYLFGYNRLPVSKIERMLDCLEANLKSHHRITAKKQIYTQAG
jgi:hypothetical protein